MKSIFGQYNLEQVKKIGGNTMFEHLGMEITSIENNQISGKMPVDHRTVQPMHILHGGASCAFAESIASVGAYLTVNPDTHYCVGIEINANHIRPVKSGYVYGVASPLHMGKTSQVWSIEIRNDEQKLVCISRMTIAVVARQ
ncbi:MAG: hotdog fold thioesterase [Bacteroidetes bacterium]|nr:hotdog fold thioesterase [Bacteroidota bacterium]